MSAAPADAPPASDAAAPGLRRLLLVHDVPGERGGAETHFWSEVALLRARGFEVFVFTFADAGAGGADDRHLHFAEPRSWRLRKLLKFTFHPGAYRALRRWVRRVRPDVVHLHVNTRYPLSVLLALRGVPVVQTVHSNGLFCPTGWLVHADDLAVCDGGAGARCVRHGCVPLRRLPLHLLLERAWHAAARRYVAAFVSPSRHLARALGRFGLGPVHHVPNFSPLDDDERSDPGAGEPDTLLYVGVLTRQKGVAHLLEAMPEILRRRPAARLLVVGDGPERTSLEQLATRLGLDERVRFVGRVPNQALAAYYRQARVCVLPSLWLENSPVVAYEAMLAGRPLVGSDRGGIPDLIEGGGCGFVVVAGQPRALAQRVVELLEDPALAVRLGASGRRHAREALSREAFWQRLQPVLRACSQRGGLRRPD